MKPVSIFVSALAGLVLLSSANASEHIAHGHDRHHAHAMAAGQTIPSDGAVLDESPPHFMVQFGHAMKVENLMLVTLTGETINLDISELGQSDRIMVGLPQLQADEYTAIWRAIGDDEHVMSGSISFVVE
ncbi:MAG: hypothetical protein CME93_05330 [Hyphomonadaceae bacterium]|nr:hypothetical protein [Hyphomonadaceae bacterium]OUX94777.1 MAG: hypothetical protein CBB77_06900 [Hyphomonas sp. TMED17]